MTRMISLNIELDGIDLVAFCGYSPGEPQTWDHPGEESLLIPINLNLNYQGKLVCWPGTTDAIDIMGIVQEAAGDCNAIPEKIQELCDEAYNKFCAEEKDDHDARQAGY